MGASWSSQARGRPDASTERRSSGVAPRAEVGGAASRDRSVPRPSLTRAVGLMLLASACFAGMGALVKVASADASFLLVVLVRSAVIVVVTVALVRFRRAPWRARNRPLMLWRSLTGFTAMCCYFFAVGELPLSTAITIQYTAPVFVALLAPVVVGERLPRGGIVLVLGAFGGAALVLSPEASSLNPGVVAGTASAVLAAFAYLAVRALRATDQPETIVLHFSVFSVLASLPGLVWADPVSWETLWVLIGVGVLAAGGQLGMTYAFRFGPAATVSAFSYSTVLFGAVVGVTVFDDPAPAHSVVGTALVIAAGAALSALTRERPASPPGAAGPPEPSEGAR